MTRFLSMSAVLAVMAFFGSIGRPRRPRRGATTESWLPTALAGSRRSAPVFLSKLFAGVFRVAVAGLTLAPSMAGAQCVTPVSGMRAWWPLDELSGTTAQDIAGANPGAYGTSGHEPGQYVENSLKVTAAAQFVEVGSNANLDFGTGSFSIDAWVRTFDAATSVRTILDKREFSPSIRGYSLSVSFGRLVFQLADGGTFTNFATIANPLTNGQWNHVTVTVDRAGGAAGGKLYINGVAETFDPTVRPGSVTNSGNLRIGQAADNSSINFNGNIDEVVLYGRALDPTEVSSISGSGAQGVCREDRTVRSFSFSGNSRIDVDWIIVSARRAADIGTILEARVNGVLVAFTPVPYDHSADGGCDCGRSGCASGQACAQSIRYFTCRCYRQNNTSFDGLALQPGDLVEVSARPAPGAVLDAYSADDSGRTTFPLPFGPSVSAIPALGAPALVVLVVLLLATSLWLLRRRSAFKKDPASPG